LQPDPLGLTLQMFVSCLAADTELLAQLRDRETLPLREDDKSIYLVHVGYAFPGHCAQKCNPSLRFKCYLSRRIEPTSGVGVSMTFLILGDRRARGMGAFSGRFGRTIKRYVFT